MNGVKKKGTRTWEHNQDNPILAKRDKRYNFFKRFINRQLRNFNRYKKIVRLIMERWPSG